MAALAFLLRYFGRDRTSVIAALYKMYFLGMSPEEAMQYLRESGYGFKYGWLRGGLTRYLKKHPTPPADLLSDANGIVTGESFPAAESSERKR